ncbi:MAG: fluoride efflux transporter FluC [Rubrimonas sp.]
MSGWGRSVAVTLCAGLGAALGAAARLGLALRMVEDDGALLPLATLAANVGGSALIGLYAALTRPDGPWAGAGPAQRAFVATGFCGGFTTFSIFSLDVIQRALGGQPVAAGVFALSSLILWLAAARVGYGIGLGFGARSPMRRPTRRPAR